MTPVAATKTSSPGDEIVGREHTVDVVAGVDERLPLLVVARPELPLDRAAEALDRRRRDHALGRAADAHQHVDARAGPSGGDRGRDVAVGDQPHLRPGTPAASAISGSWRSRSRTTTLTSSECIPFASATRRTFSAGGASMSIASAASGPTAILSM